MVLKHNPFESARRVEPPKSSPRTREVSNLRVFDDPPTKKTQETAAFVGEQFPNKQQEESLFFASDVRERLGNSSPTTSSDSLTVAKQFPNSQGTSSPTNPLTSSPTVRRSLLDRLVGQRRKLVDLFFDSCLKAGGGQETGRITTIEISTKTLIPPASKDIVLKRLRDAGLVTLAESRSGPGGWSRYVLSAELFRELMVERGRSSPTNSPTSSPTNWGTNPTLVSSSSLNTTTDKDRAELFQTACERYGLHEMGIGANDLLQLWRKGVFQTEEDFITSLEHIAFYLGTAEAKTLTHPKAWVTSQLAKGFYPAPVGFKSFEERQQEARVAAKRVRLARLEELKRQELDADFELWAAELDDDEKKRRLAGTPFAEHPNSKLGRTILREQFIKHHNGDGEALT